MNEALPELAFGLGRVRKLGHSGGDARLKRDVENVLGHDLCFGRFGYLCGSRD